METSDLEQNPPNLQNADFFDYFFFEINRSILRSKQRSGVYFFSDFSNVLNSSKTDLCTCMLVN